MADSPDAEQRAEESQPDVGTEPSTDTAPETSEGSNAEQRIQKLVGQRNQAREENDHLKQQVEKLRTQLGDQNGDRNLTLEDGGRISINDLKDTMASAVNDIIHNKFGDIERRLEANEVHQRMGLNDEQLQLMGEIKDKHESLSHEEVLALARARKPELWQEQSAAGYDPSIHGTMTPGLSADARAGQPEQTDHMADIRNAPESRSASRSGQA